MRTTHFLFMVAFGTVLAGRPGCADLVVPDAVVLERGLEFSHPDGQSLSLDLARPKTGEGPFPTIVCIHGGGFRAGTRESYDGMCLTLAQRGSVAVTISYRLAPASRFPAAVQDCKAAVRWLGRMPLPIPSIPTADPYVAFEQAGWMVDRLRACAVDAELLSFPGAGHGLSGEDAIKEAAAMIAFFDRHLRPGTK